MDRKCIFCGKDLEKIKTEKRYFDLYSKKPLIINEKEYYRIMCADCFYSKYNRYPKAGLTYDLIDLLGLDKCEIEKICKEKFSRGIDVFIRKHGEIEGKKKYKEYCKQQSYTNTFEYKQKRFGWSRERFEEYNKSRGVTLSNLIKKYGEVEGKRKFEEYCEKQSYSNKLDYFIEKFGKELGTEKYNLYCKNKGVTLSNLIKKYGEVEGKRKFEEYCEKQSYSQKIEGFIQRYGEVEGKRKFEERLRKIFNFNTSHSYSKISQKLFFEICNILKLNKKEVFFKKNNGEKQIKCLNHIYFPDFIYKDKIIEFYGDYWHLNPKFYCKDKKVKLVHDGYVYPSEIWKRDNERIELLRAEGYKILIIWEDEFKRSKQKAVEKCINHLMS